MTHIPHGSAFLYPCRLVHLVDHLRSFFLDIFFNVLYSRYICCILNQVIVNFALHTNISWVNYKYKCLGTVWLGKLKTYFGIGGIL